MARVIPKSAWQQEKTPGEDRLLRALSAALNDECIIWWNPILEPDRKPDFIVYVPGLGLIIYEVKDWTEASILNVGWDKWIVRHGGIPKSETSPFKRTQKYFEVLQTQLEKERSLLHHEGPHLNKLKIPIAKAVALPKITYDYYNSVIGVTSLSNNSFSFLRTLQRSRNSQVL